MANLVSQPKLSSRKLFRLSVSSLLPSKLVRERVSQVDEEVGEVVTVKVVEFTTLKQVSDFVVTLRKGDALPLHLYEIYFTDNLSDAALRNTNELAVAFR